MELNKCSANSKKILFTEEQMRCFISAGKKSLIIRGGVKTGKSTVLKKMYEKMLEYSEGNQENNIVYCENIEAFNMLVNEEVEKLDLDDLITKKKCILSDEERRQYVEEAKKSHKDKFGRHRFHDLDAKLWLDEFDWIRGINIDKNEIDKYLDIDRSCRDNIIKMNSTDKVIAFQIFSIYCDILEENRKWDSLDQALFLFRHKESIHNSAKVEHILFDDVQKLQMVQASVLGMLYKKTIVATIDDEWNDLWNYEMLGRDIEAIKLSVKHDSSNLTVEESNDTTIVKKTIEKQKRNSMEKRKYTIDKSKARGSLYRQIQEKEGARIRLADGIDTGKEDKSKLDKGKFNELVEEKTLSSLVEACKMIRKCIHSRSMDEHYKEIIERLCVLQESIEKNRDIYEPDIYEFCDYYIPEALRLTEKYLEHVDAGLRWKILHDNELEIISALEELLVAIDDKIEEIYRFASIEIEARARALESVMNQDGFVKSEFKFN